MPHLLVELLNFSFFNFKNVKPYTIQKYTKVVATYITHIATQITHADHITTVGTIFVRKILVVSGYIR
jgi:hypothetical protein